MVLSIRLFLLVAPQKKQVECLWGRVDLKETWWIVVFFLLKSKKVLEKVSELHLNKIWGGITDATVRQSRTFDFS